ncbi:serine/threonine protein phosphatase [Pseudomonas putida SJ3]|jgi:predicted phosphodiesterase|uniref:Metallophosphoesterase n=1 Tax=Pseudomonas fortuita TaxID=3233375 RepID=A0ACD4P733_9PSED|nr:MULTISPECIES: metallophosphoesterase [Pseudomonas]ERT19651.1 serine/threonine protein phosphatase [Pseudomonas putida SJ3]WAP63558.1 metallophosphoesterase [Pseudomonas putida]
MKILIYSDLHLEFADFQPPAVEADLVVLAGDISVRSRGVLWANETFSCPVIYACGNHEFYKGHLSKTLIKMQGAAAEHVHVLDNQTLIIGDTRFLVATAWTDFTATGDYKAAMRVCAEGMTDFKRIRIGEGYSKLRPVDLIARNIATRDFLEAELGKGFDGKTVVITHHCPIQDVAGDGHEGHLGAAYFNQWHDLVSQADVWIFGHTHHAVDTLVSGCRVVSNPRGYPGERTGFSSDFTIEI